MTRSSIDSHQNISAISPAIKPLNYTPLQVIWKCDDSETSQLIDTDDTYGHQRFKHEKYLDFYLFYDSMYFLFWLNLDDLRGLLSRFRFWVCSVLKTYWFSEIHSHNWFGNCFFFHVFCSPKMSQDISHKNTFCSPSVSLTTSSVSSSTHTSDVDCFSTVNFCFK